MPEISTKATTSDGLFDFRKMRWYEWIVLLPTFILLILGGVVGAVFGIIGAGFSLKTIRDPSKSKVYKIASVLGITVATYVIFILTATIITNLFKN